MAGEAENKEGQNQGAEKGAIEPAAGSTGSEQPTVNTNEQGADKTSATPFAPPKVLEAVIDTKKTQAPGPQKFSFTNPKAIQEKLIAPTKGDLAAKTEQPAAAIDKTRTLEYLDAQIARDEKGDKKDLSYDDYEDSATMFLDFWEGTMTMICRAISKDTSDTAYEFPQPKREKLIRQLTKVSRKKGWVMPIELMAGGTLLAATTQVVLKARDKRKEYMKSIKKEETSLDESTKTEKIPSTDNASTGKRKVGRPSK